MTSAGLRPLPLAGASPDLYARTLPMFVTRWSLLSSSLFAIVSLSCGERSSIHGMSDAGDTAGDVGDRDALPTRDDAGPTDNDVIVGIVFDGDTIVAYAADGVFAPDGRPMDGEHIRFLGIDAPEVAHPPEPADCWADEAKWTVDAYVGRGIELEFDEPHGLRDRFDRLLAYIHVDGKVLNEELLRRGDVRAFRQFPHKYSDRYSETRTGRARFARNVELFQLMDHDREFAARLGDITLVIPCGGRGRRMGGLIKPLLLRADGTSLTGIERTLRALVDATMIVAPQEMQS